LYESWRTDTAPLTAEALHKKVIRHFGGAAIGGIGVFVTKPDGQHRLGVLLGPRVYPGPLVGDSPLADNTFGYQGDISKFGFGTLVQIQDELFAATEEINVLTNDHHKTTLEGDATLDAVRPVTDNAPHSETVRTRQSMYIPYELIPLLLGRSLTAREASLEVHTSLGGSYLRGAAQPLLRFLRVGGTLGTGDVVKNVHPSIGPAFRMDDGLQEYMHTRVIQRDLPHYREGASTVDPALVPLTDAMETLVRRDYERELETAARREAEKAPTGFEEVLKARTPSERTMPPMAPPALSTATARPPLRAARTAPIPGKPSPRIPPPTVLPEINSNGAKPLDPTSGPTPNSRVPDRLDREVARATRAYLQASSYEEFVRKMRGRGDLEKCCSLGPSSFFVHQECLL